jgi:hypothetical protein
MTDEDHVDGRVPLHSYDEFERAVWNSAFGAAWVAMRDSCSRRRDCEVIADSAVSAYRLSRDERAATITPYPQWYKP